MNNTIKQDTGKKGRFNMVESKAWNWKEVKDAIWMSLPRMLIIMSTDGRKKDFPKFWI